LVGPISRGQRLPDEHVSDTTAIAQFDAGILSPSKRTARLTLCAFYASLPHLCAKAASGSLAGCDDGDRPGRGESGEFAVNSTSDPGTSGCNATECAVREAITAANATAGTDTINFAIPGTGVRPISPASPLHDTIEALTTNGYGQPGTKANALPAGNDAVLRVQLNGTNAGTGFEASGLAIVSDRSR
jgi:hypothetical protein